MKGKLEILAEIFKPVSQDCQTTKQDLQLAIILNPDLDKILEAMDEYSSHILQQAKELTARMSK